jgi:hypothetical protein
MNEEQKAGQSTPARTLREHIMGSVIPKGEAEWWAKREIERLEAELLALRNIRDTTIPNLNAEWSEKLRVALKEAEALREKYSTQCPDCSDGNIYEPSGGEKDAEMGSYKCPNCVNGRVMMLDAEGVKAKLDVCKRAKSPDAYRETANALSWVLKGSSHD